MASGQYRVKLQKYNDLIAWQKAMDFVGAVYRASRTFPREEAFGLMSQLRRAVVSIPSNIAEGQSRRETREFLQHLGIAMGSLGEVETQLLIGARLNYITRAKSEELLAMPAELGRVMNGLSNAVSKRA